MWIALYSQTGSEIVNLSTQLGRKPDLVIKNIGKKQYNEHPGLHTHNIIRLSPAQINDFLEMVREPSIVTLHGYLRILPEQVCNNTNLKIYNGHPGDIINYPELKGKDPQHKALLLGLPSTGVVLHEVTPELDDGKIVAFESFYFDDDMYTDHDAAKDLNNLIKSLKDIQLKLWVNILKDKICV